MYEIFNLLNLENIFCSLEERQKSDEDGQDANSKMSEQIKRRRHNLEVERKVFSYVQHLCLSRELP